MIELPRVAGCRLPAADHADAGRLDAGRSVVNGPDMSAIAPRLLRLVRVVLLVVLFAFVLSTVIAIGALGTGPWEKMISAVVFVGLLALAVPVHRIGRRG